MNRILSTLRLQLLNLSVMDAVFDGVGKEPALQIWRVENFELCLAKEAPDGKFYDGDSYIALKTTLSDTSLSHHIHFWIGENSSQDEFGVAAIKAVELDDYLGGSPIQHRETQGHESALFSSYFPKGLTYLKGGVASGFRQVDPDDYQSALFHVKGRHNVRVKQVEISCESLNRSDCFILDTVNDVYVFYGESCNLKERINAIQAATGIRDSDHAGSAKIHILDDSADRNLYEEFFGHLGGGSLEDVTDSADDDTNYEVLEQKCVTLFKVSDCGSESIQVEEIGTGELTQDLLVDGDSYILNTGRSGLYVWIGRKSSKEERAAAMKHSTSFLQQQDLPSWTKVERVVQGAEPTVFKRYFIDWEDDHAQIGLGQVFTTNRIADALPGVQLEGRSQSEQRHLIAESAGAALGFLPDDGSGHKEIFRVENMELVSLPEHMYGTFFGGDSYVIKYNSDASAIIYFWQGRESSQDEKAAAAIHAVKLDNECGGSAVQIRVTQGQEPRHFLTMFKGKMVVYRGGKASGFRNVKDHDTYDPEDCRLFQLLGVSAELDARAIQLPAERSQLLKDRVLLADLKGSCYVWHGEESCVEEQNLSEHFSAILVPDTPHVVVKQGEEPAELLEALPHGDPLNTARIKSGSIRQKQFMHCRIDGSGRFLSTVVESTEQKMLNEDDLIVADSGDEIYCWIGGNASQIEKEKAFSLAEMILRSHGHGSSAAVIAVKQGHEPDSFKQLFTDWHDDYFQNAPKLDDVKSLISRFNV